MKSTRRQFLQKTAGTAGALAVSRNILIEAEHLPSAFESAVPASDRLRFGIGHLRTKLSDITVVLSSRLRL